MIKYNPLVFLYKKIKMKRIVIISLILYLALGPSLTLEIRAQDTVSTFRKFTAGPWDIDMAKELSLDSLKGKYGVDNVHSAIHCFDLEEDGRSECEYAFKFA